MLDSDVTDKLHHVDGFTYTGTTKQTNFTTLSKRAYQVDYFYTGFQQFVTGRQFIK